MTIVDVWMQQPTRRFQEQPMFESLRRWARQDAIPGIPLDATVAAMDQAGVAIEGDSVVPIGECPPGLPVGRRLASG